MEDFPFRTLSGIYLLEWFLTKGAGLGSFRNRTSARLGSFRRRLGLNGARLGLNGARLRLSRSRVGSRR